MLLIHPEVTTSVHWLIFSLSVSSKSFSQSLSFLLCLWPSKFLNFSLSLFEVYFAEYGPLFQMAEIFLDTNTAIQYIN